MGKRKKKQQQRKGTGLDRLERDLRADGLPENMLLVRRPPGESKISMVFLDFIEPFKQFVTSDAGMEKLIVIGIAAWNATLLSDDKRQELIALVMKDVSKPEQSQARADTDSMLKTLMKRKQEQFAADHRFIVNYRLDSTRDNYHLSMVSTILPKSQDATR